MKVAGKPMPVPAQGGVVDAFDAEGTFVQRIARSAVMRPEKTGLYGKGGHVLLARESKGIVRYALSVRSLQRNDWPGHYDFTAGGMAAPGETELDAVVRKAQEELGIRLEREALQEIARMTPDRGYNSFGAVYACTWDGLALAEDPRVVEGFLWLSASELADLRYSDHPMEPDLGVYVRSLVVL